MNKKAFYKAFVDELDKLALMAPAGLGATGGGAAFSMAAPRPMAPTMNMGMMRRGTGRPVPSLTTRAPTPGAASV
jgi:hypothetical protein